MTEEYKFKVEKSHQDNRVFVACNNLQIELYANEYGVEVTITKGNEILKSMEVDFE